MTAPAKKPVKPAAPKRSRAIVPAFEGFAIRYQRSETVPHIEISFASRDDALIFAEWLRTRKR